MTRNDLEQWARKVTEEAYAADPYRADELAMAVLGRTVWSWDLLTIAQLRAVSRAMFHTALASRG